MKMWISHGTEHSANLRMVGVFRDASSAEAATDCIEELVKYVSGKSEDFDKVDRYSQELMDLLQKFKMYILAPSELDQFRYDVSCERHENTVNVSTDELDISAYLKVLIHNGARVEIYSAHDYPDAAPQKDAT